MALAAPLDDGCADSLWGLNISVLGLVGLPRAALGVLAEVFTLLVALGGVYAAGVVILNRSRFGGASSA
jgi:hypothetical protein